MKKIVLVVLALFGLAAANMSADPYMGFVDQEAADIFNGYGEDTMKEAVLELAERYDRLEEAADKIAKDIGDEYETDLVYYFAKLSEGYVDLVAHAVILTCKKDGVQYIHLYKNDPEKEVYGQLVKSSAVKTEDGVNAWDLSNSMIKEYTQYDFPIAVMRLDGKVVWNVNKVKGLLK